MGALLQMGVHTPIRGVNKIHAYNMAKAEAKCEISAQFLTLSCINFRI